jgi:hypothetical protein
VPETNAEGKEEAKTEANGEVKAADKAEVEESRKRKADEATEPPKEKQAKRGEGCRPSLIIRLCELKKKTETSEAPKEMLSTHSNDRGGHRSHHSSAHDHVYGYHRTATTHNHIHHTAPFSANNSNTRDQEPPKTVEGISVETSQNGNRFVRVFGRGFPGERRFVPANIACNASATVSVPTVEGEATTTTIDATNTVPFYFNNNRGYARRGSFGRKFFQPRQQGAGCSPETATYRPRQYQYGIRQQQPRGRFTPFRMRVDPYQENSESSAGIPANVDYWKKVIAGKK